MTCGYYSLNPCSNGRDSQRANEDYKKRIKQAVLILVLMEDTLRDTMRMASCTRRCLNPYSNGRYSQSCKRARVY